MFHNQEQTHADPEQLRQDRQLVVLHHTRVQSLRHRSMETIPLSFFFCFFFVRSFVDTAIAYTLFISIHLLETVKPYRNFNDIHLKNRWKHCGLEWLALS